MTLRPSQSLSTHCRLRTAVTLAVAAATTALFITGAHAQTGGGTTGASADITAGEAGSTLTSQNVFSSTADGASAIGENAGRFTTSRLATQPTAGGSTNATQQNAINQARNLQRLNQQFGGSNQNRNTANTQGTRTIRPSLRLGFTPTPRPTEDLRTSLGKQIQALTVKVPRLADGRSEYASVKFDFGNRGEVILTGEVPNDDAGRLLANILRMEPGVTSVRNDLTTAPAATPESTSK
jgi:hypothetical protein